MLQGPSNINDDDIFLELMAKPENDITIVSGDGCGVYGATAPKYINTWNKLNYMIWLISKASNQVKPDEITTQSGEISSGTLALNFESSAKYDILAYEIHVGFNDQTANGALVFTHTFDDEANEASTFQFSVKPTQANSRVLYLASQGEGAKYIPAVHKGSNGLALTATTPTAAARNNSFSITGPNNARVTILPISQFSTQLNRLMQQSHRVVLGGLGVA